MRDEYDVLPSRERARVRARDRKNRQPKMVVDNAGLRDLTMRLAEKRRERLRRQKADQRPSR